MYSISSGPCRRVLTAVLLLTMAAAACGGAGEATSPSRQTAAAGTLPAPSTAAPVVVEVTREVEVTRIVEVTRVVTVTAVVTATPTPTPVAAPPAEIPVFDWSALLRPEYAPNHPAWQNKGAILFRSDAPQQSGLWIMDPDGGNRRYLGQSRELAEEVERMRRQETYSPAGSCWAHTEAGGDRSSTISLSCVVSMGPGEDAFREILGCPLTQEGDGFSYDPVWSPDGRYIAFVSQHAGSDDIWIASPCRYGVNRPNDLRNLTENDWEWDKRPSWSPDSTQLVFWSNRTGTRQIFTLDMESGAVTQLSNTTWDEYDPLWIK